SREFVKFLNHLEEQLPADQEVHLIMDNYYPKERRGAALAEAEEAEEVPLSFHPDQQFLVESSGTLLCVDYRPHDPPRDLPQQGRARAGDLPLAGNLEWRSNTVYLESPGRCHPRQGPAL